MSSSEKVQLPRPMEPNIQRRLVTNFIHIAKLQGQVPDLILPRQPNGIYETFLRDEPTSLAILNWLSQCLVRGPSGDVIVTAFSEEQTDHSLILHIFSNRAKGETEDDLVKANDEQGRVDEWPRPLIEVMCSAITDRLKKPSKTFTREEIDDYTERFLNVTIGIASARIKAKLGSIKHCSESGLPSLLPRKGEISPARADKSKPEEKVQEILDRYVDSWPSGKEFPASVRNLYDDPEFPKTKDEHPSVRLKGSLGKIMKVSELDGEPERDGLKRKIHWCDTLLSCMNDVDANLTEEDSVVTDAATEKLRRRLSRIARYRRGAIDFLTTGITYLLNTTSIGQHDQGLHFKYQVSERGFDKVKRKIKLTDSGYSNILTNVMAESLQELSEQESSHVKGYIQDEVPEDYGWTARKQVTVREHCETKAARFFDAQNIEILDNAIGVSKLSCLACYLYFDSLQSTIPDATKFHLSGTSAKAYSTWKIPQALKGAVHYSQDAIDKAVGAVDKAAYRIAKGAGDRKFIETRWDSSETVGSDSTSGFVDIRSEET